MEKTRQLEDRLQKIIKEVSTLTGGEIKNQVIEEFAQTVNSIANQNYQKHTLHFMALLKKSIDQL